MSSFHRSQVRAPIDAPIDNALLDAAMRVVSEDGLPGMTLDRVAATAGTTRVTLWRQGVTHDRLIEGLIKRMMQRYRDALWPILTASGSGRARLTRALRALCEVADQHLPLLLATDTAFQESFILTQRDFIEPLERLLRDGAVDGTLRIVKVEEMAPVLFNCVCWAYVHLRTQRQLPPDRAISLLLDVTLYGVVAPESTGREPSEPATIQPVDTISGQR
jgi:AcrR family transcriptional regulator